MSSPQNPQFDPQLVTSDQHEAAPFVAPLVVPPPVPLAQSPAPKANENPVWSGWDVALLAALSFGLVLIVQTAIVLGARRFAYPHLTWVEVAQKPVLALWSEFVAYGFVALYMILLLEVKYRARFWAAIRWNWPGVRGWSFLGFGVLMVGLDIVGARFLPVPKTTPFDQFFERPMDAYLTAVFAVTLGPLMEELFFRGFLYPVLARRVGAFWSVLVTAILFGSIHSPQYGYSWAAVLIVCMVGVVLTTVRALTKSVASSFLAHVAYNATLMTFAALATDGFKHMEKSGLALF